MSRTVGPSGYRNRRQLLKAMGGLALSAGSLAVLSGCGMVPASMGAAGKPGASKVPRIGFLSSGSAEADTADMLQEGLKSLGHSEGQSLDIEWRFADGDAEQLRESAAELVGLDVQVIVVDSGAIPTAKQATGTIPIVMAFSSDPDKLGYVASLERPGGNVTGMAFAATEVAGKGPGLLKAAVPGASRVAVLWSGGSQAMTLEFEEARKAAQALGMEVISLDVRDADGLERALDPATHGHLDALITLLGGFTSFHRDQIVGLASRYRLPGLYPHRSFAEAGGLMAYGPSFGEAYRRAATYVDKILKGARPADLPVERLTRAHLTINLTAAQALGLTIPQSVLAEASEVIQ